MTDNDKVATFIGWRLDVACRGWLGGKSGCRDCGDGMSEEAHNIPSPDMTKLENWTQALEWLIHRLYMVSFLEGGYDDGDPFECIIHFSNLHDSFQKKVEGQSGESLADAFIIAAAQIHDFEQTQWPNVDLK